MDEGKPSPLDGIIEEESAKTTFTSPDAVEDANKRIADAAETANSNGRITSIGKTGYGRSDFIPGDDLRKLRETTGQDIATLANQVKVLQAMILALRAAVGAAALAGIIAILQNRKLQKRVVALEGGKPEGRTIEIEASASKKVEPAEVGD